MRVRFIRSFKCEANKIPLTFAGEWSEIYSDSAGFMDQIRLINLTSCGCGIGCCIIRINCIVFVYQQ